MSTIYDPVTREFQGRIEHAGHPSRVSEAVPPAAFVWPSDKTDSHRRHHRRHHRQFYAMLIYWLAIFLSGVGICLAVWMWSQWPQHKLAQRWPDTPFGPYSDH